MIFFFFLDKRILHLFRKVQIYYFKRPLTSKQDEPVGNFRGLRFGLYRGILIKSGLLIILNIYRCRVVFS